MQRFTLIHLDPHSRRRPRSYSVRELLLEIACSSTCFLSSTCLDETFSHQGRINPLQGHGARSKLGAPDGAPCSRAYVLFFFFQKCAVGGISSTKILKIVKQVITGRYKSEGIKAPPIQPTCQNKIFILCLLLITDLITKEIGPYISVRRSRGRRQWRRSSPGERPPSERRPLEATFLHL